MNWGGVVGGALALIAVQKLTASSQGPGAVKGITGAASTAVTRFLDPFSPLWSDAVIARAAAIAPGSTKAAPSAAVAANNAFNAGPAATGKAIVSAGNAIKNLLAP